MARQIRDACAYERSDAIQGVVVPLDVGNESLIPLRFERGQVVRHITRQQHVAFCPSYEVAGVSWAVSRRGQRDDGAVRREGPTSGEPESGRSIAVEHSGHKSARQRRRNPRGTRAWLRSSSSRRARGTVFSQPTVFRQETQHLP